MIISGNNWSITLEENSSQVRITGGNFGMMKLMESSLFCAEFENLSTKETKTVTSSDNLKNVSFVKTEDSIKFVFQAEDDICISVKGVFDENGISWETEVENNSEIFTVTNVSYPVLKVKNEIIDIFIPQFSGRVLKDYAKDKHCMSLRYPAHCSAEMQYFAFYNENGGIYMGIHDPDASVKCFKMNVEKSIAELDTCFFAIGASSGKNSFRLGGTARWEFIKKDWYDATEIYAEFVHKYAKWLPEKGDNGRSETPDRFKEVPLWIMDYIPNSEKQMDARPMILGSVSQMYDADYWYSAPVLLKKKLGVPIAYHVYNWHEIPFNINYPHFIPAKDEFRKGLKYLKDAGIYVIPYINSVSWETKDADEGFEMNFDNTGIDGAVIEKFGKIAVAEYPQIKKSGEKTLLAPICPGFTRWHDIIKDTVREMESTLDIDGVYFDEVAAHRAYPCLSTQHNHLPGGGSHWSDNYNLMMEKIKKDKPEENFYLTESNCEGYMKGFDGYLTWLWTKGDLVPAFPAVYSGYVQMVGRLTDGKTREDDDFFRFHMAQELVFGQQLGWIHPNIVYNEARMEFLKKVIDIRCKYTKLFNSGKLLRPPVITSNIPPVESSGIVMQQVQGGLWQSEDKKKKVLFVINVSGERAECKVGYQDEEVEMTLSPYEFYVKEI